MKAEEYKQASCPVDEIAAYIDGELDLGAELELEFHLAECSVCADELREQRQFLCGLDSSLRGEDQIELPADFAKVIVANAESSVEGLRRPRELYNAFFICVALSIFVLFAMGADATQMVEGVRAIYERTGVVLGFFGHLVYSLFLGIVIILRSLAAQVRFDQADMLPIVSVIAISLLLASRKLLLTRRT